MMKACLKHWFKNLSGDDSEDAVVQSWIEDYVRSETPFHLHVGENKGAGIGVMILDPQKRPITAYSLYNYSSAFYNVLLGVNIALALAIKLKLVRISLLFPSDMVASSPGYGNDDKTYLLMVFTLSLLLDFYREGENVLDIAVVKASNRSAAYVAEHGNGKGKITLRKLLENNELLSLLTEEADIQGAIMASTLEGQA
ncbi:hypothetical protein C5167_047146 [Papaver somniferum]|uniref:Uncharacterized protein n=1 Tax=Papaver somniferum TaxID=3469 RepID=A0A4Y7LJE5_PAPSO|nr:hypothetical protein C5167_047146 [Papaver somniferum]